MCVCERKRETARERERDDFVTSSNDAGTVPMHDANVSWSLKWD